MPDAHIFRIIFIGAMLVLVPLVTMIAVIIYQFIAKATSDFKEWGKSARKLRIKNYT
jgi:hypothetical protein